MYIGNITAKNIEGVIELLKKLEKSSKKIQVRFWSFGFIEKDKEGDSAVVGPLPLMQDAANQDIRE